MNSTPLLVLRMGIEPKPHQQTSVENFQIGLLVMRELNQQMNLSEHQQRRKSLTNKQGLRTFHICVVGDERIKPANEFIGTPTTA